MTPRDARTLAELNALLARSRGQALKRLAKELADDDRAGVQSAVAAAVARDRARQREVARLKRLYSLEAELRAQGWQVVAGVDEVGRGALAGPLTAGACVLPATPRLVGLNDSKMLTPARREQLAFQIREVALCWSVAHVPAAELDALGMTAALRRAMGRALSGLELPADHVVVDGRPMGVAERETAVVGGDGKVAAVAAASILAKVTRDALMVQLAETHPAYNFEINKGYGTPDHLAALDTSGLCTEHRRSFMPCGGSERLF
ncbi:MAG TPA: ribonuclease HII [Coriobacteriia bacterium]|nr:ribonuclease HII [Coriobacteriia bacterium]